MNSLNYIKSIIKTKKCHLIIEKKSEIGFWDYQVFGLLSLLLNKKKDYLIITEKRIIYVIENELIKNIEYYDFSYIKFNSLNDTISFKDLEKKDKRLNLKNFRITYEEIQTLKKALNQK